MSPPKKTNNLVLQAAALMYIVAFDAAFAHFASAALLAQQMPLLEPKCFKAAVKNCKRVTQVDWLGPFQKEFLEES